MRSKTTGSALLIAGTTIGAGMLALPLVAATTGFIPAMAMMIVIWALAAWSGLLTAEINKACPEDKTLHGIAGRILGKPGQLINSAAMLVLFYSLCAAYISGGSGQLAAIVQQATGIQISHVTACISVTFLVAIIVVAGARGVDLVNRALFIGMLTALGIVLSLLLPEVEPVNLNTSHATLGNGLLLASLPVLFTSFGYHVVVPSVVHYLDGSTRHIRRAVLIGSTLPMAVYILWKVSANGVLPEQGFAGLGQAADPVSAMTTALGAATGSVVLAGLISTFAMLALATSFLGVTLGLFDYLAEATGRKNNLNGRLQTILITLMPPLLAALYAPGIFITALGFAAIALVVTAILLPVAIAWKIRNSRAETVYQVRGGKPALVMASVTGVIIIGVQLAITTNMLPAIG